MPQLSILQQRELMTSPAWFCGGDGGGDCTSHSLMWFCGVPHSLTCEIGLAGGCTSNIWYSRPGHCLFSGRWIKFEIHPVGQSCTGWRKPPAAACLINLDLYLKSHSDHPLFLPLNSVRPPTMYPQQGYLQGQEVTLWVID